MTLPQRNMLADEASPYLRQHAENPVHWRAWSQAALDEARASDRPILLSIGYAACHWCHVMAHESFENAEIAGVMNRLFVNIKVDREERPDIDQIYMASLSAMGEQGGWPLTMFLTPDGKPFWGGTYFPPTSRYGRPGFVQVLEAVDKAWREKRSSIAQSADGLVAHVAARLSSAEPRTALTKDTLDGLAAGIQGMIDWRGGGLSGAPKFPNAPFTTTLWLSWLQTGNTTRRDAVLLGLRKMLAGGIYDHVGGGLCRYSTDAEWTVPHFEKMLYDNAQLLRLANWAYAETGDELFRHRIEETVAWLLRDMRVDGGAFASSYDADSEGEEGLYYCWTDGEIADALGSDSGLFSRYFSLVSPSAWEGKPILRQTGEQRDASVTDHAVVAGLKAKLLASRSSRIAPGRDDKVLADWNGLAITALAECGRSFGRTDWIEAAAQAFSTILSATENGRIPHSILGSKKLFPALSGDYAALINAAVALFEATHDQKYINIAKGLAEQLDRWHDDSAGTGHFLSASDSADVPIRIRGDVDEAIPSATGQIVEALARLATATGDLALQDKAYIVAEHAMGRASKQAYGQAGIVNSCVLVLEPLKLVIIESSDNPSLVPVANRNPDPRRVDLIVPLGDAAPGLPGGLVPTTERPGAYYCTGQVCLPVVTEPEELERLLRRKSG
ncbi:MULTISPECIES: thioredoxin domain-containing protein [Phyllobacteriaceae]|uniref:Thioredoxin domain protein n=2 Tax=Hyphomicrobiales TaxID=356 RepID=A0A1C2DED6_9HYPH|nr:MULTISPECIES: thioredoxin domain-containing protein [unclassified Mesorhizobium]MBN9232807.1 thioredoxin domain-containing protein [Mesorhizobium sp.]OCX13100.1 thioredoxin domain protein [Mesorhizobium hungaricum]